METKFRPIPITIVDFLGILVPGFTWLLLLVTTFEIFSGASGKGFATPLSSLQIIADFQKTGDSWFRALSLIFASLSVGWIVKPFAMRSTQFAAKWLTKFSSETRHISAAEARFPFPAIFQGTECYREILKMLKTKLDCKPEDLPGSQPFSAAKRFLRLVAPALWEECERMEAEGRLAGSMFLATAYSTLLSLGTVVAHYAVAYKTEIGAAWCWFALSAILSLLLGISFNRLRVREVGYTYVSALIAARCVNERTGPSRGGKQQENED